MTKSVYFFYRREIQLVKYASFIKGVHIAFTVFRSRTAIFACILAYVTTGNVLTAEKVFVVTACFNTMKRTMTDLFSYSVELLILARVALHRIEKFLLLEESSAILQIERENKLPLEKGKSNLQNGDINHSPSLIPFLNLRDIRTSRNCDKTDFHLKDINLELSTPIFVAVIGSVGSGKTSLLNVILREKVAFGKVDIRGKISYASQEPWLFNQTIKKNIILAEDLNEERYRKVLEICALLEDLKSLRFGDKTWVGERGSTLSGGQRIRVNLARALYRQADIYLLDDPLSALDTSVANHVFRGLRDFLKKKICVLVTHQHQFTSEVDHVVILEGGTVSKQGSYGKLKDDIKDCVGAPQNVEELISEMGVNDKNEKQVDVLASKEGRRKGKVGWEVYKEYLRAFGNPCFVFIIFMLFVFGQFTASASDFFIGYW